MDDKKFFHMAAVKVVFQDPEDERIGELEFNVVFPTDDGIIKVQQLSHIQRQAQIRLFQQLENPNLKVGDVLITAISHLGQCTTEEFTFQPNQPEEPTAEEAPIDPTEGLIAAGQKLN